VFGLVQLGSGMVRLLFGLVQCTFGLGQVGPGLLEVGPNTREAFVLLGFGLGHVGEGAGEYERNERKAAARAMGRIGRAWVMAKGRANSMACARLARVGAGAPAAVESCLLPEGFRAARAVRADENDSHRVRTAVRCGRGHPMQVFTPEVV